MSHRHRYQLVGDLNALEPGGPDDRLLLHQQLHAAGAMPKSTWKVAVAPFFPARGFSTGAAAIPRPDGTPTAWGPSSTPGMWRLLTFKSIECVCLLFLQDFCLQIWWPSLPAWSAWGLFIGGEAYPSFCLRCLRTLALLAAPLWPCSAFCSTLESCPARRTSPWTFGQWTRPKVR